MGSAFGSRNQLMVDPAFASGTSLYLSRCVWTARERGQRRPGKKPRGADGSPLSSWCRFLFRRESFKPRSKARPCPIRKCKGAEGKGANAGAVLKTEPH